MAKLSFDYAQLIAHPRFTALVKRLGNDQSRSVNCVLRFWNLALAKWGDGRQLVSPDDFDVDDDFPHLVDCKFAERREGGIYAKGAKDNFEWLVELRDRDTQVRAGQASAEKRREQFGTAQPQGGKGSKKSPNDDGTPAEQEPNGIRTETERDPNDHPNAPNPSISVSTSVSEKKKKRERGQRIVDPLDEELARAWFEMAERHSTTVRYGPEWPNTVRKLREVDKLTPETIRKLMEFVEANDFWRINALSIANLRTRSKANGLLKWENALSQMQQEQEAEPSSEAAWAEFDRLVAAKEARSAQ